MHNPKHDALARMLTGQKDRPRFVVGGIDLPGLSEPDFQTFFRHVPGLYLAVCPDFTIAGASDDHLRTTLTWSEPVTGRNLFDVYPDNPAGGAGGAKNLEASMRSVLQNAKAHSMGILKYDILDRITRDGSWIEKFWAPVNRPVMVRETGEVTHVLSDVRDITRVVQLALWVDGKEQLSESMLRRVRQMRADMADAAAGARARVNDDMARTGASPQTLIEELKALLDGPGGRLYHCAGEWAPRSGVYCAYHAPGCTVEARVDFYLEGATLPSCRQCGHDLVYRITQPL